MTPEEIAALPPVKPEPVRTCVSAVCLLSRRMLGSLDRRSFLESVQAARALHARADGQRAAAAGGANRCRAQKKFAPAAGALASLRSRAQPPAAPHASLPCGAAARRPPLVTPLRRKWMGRYVSTPLCLYAAMSLRCYVATSLCRYAAMSLRRYVATPLCRYAAMSLCRYVAVPRGVRARACDGRALCMCVMAVQRCTGVVGTCVARPRPQSTFANGWASGSACRNGPGS